MEQQEFRAKHKVAAVEAEALQFGESREEM